MNTYQDREGRTSVDDLLGESGMTPADQAALRVLLAPAAAPATPAELRGETAVLAAFRSVRPALAPEPAVLRSRRGPKVRLARAMSIKAAIAAITVVGMGGVAVAASTGTLPGPIDGPRHKPAKIQPSQMHPATKSADAGSNGSAQTPAVVPPGQAVSEATKGAQQRALVQQRNAERRQAQRDELLADREERLAHQAERREEQAQKRRELTEGQAERPGAQPERPQPQSERNADRANR